jgi:hypothetical protein
MQARGDANHPDFRDPKSVEKTRKELDLNTTNWNRKRKYGTDINSEVYQVQGDFRKYQAGYDLIEWD